MYPPIPENGGYIKPDEEPPRFKKGEKLDPDKFRGLIGVDEVK